MALFERRGSVRNRAARRRGGHHWLCASVVLGADVWLGRLSGQLHGIRLRTRTIVRNAKTSHAKLARRHPIPRQDVDGRHDFGGASDRHQAVLEWALVRNHSAHDVRAGSGERLEA